MQALSQRQHGALLTKSLTNLYTVEAAEVACCFALADLFDAQAEQLIAHHFFKIARRKIMQPANNAIAFAASINAKVRLFKLAEQLRQNANSLTLANLLLQQAMTILSSGDHDDHDEAVVFTLNQISQAAFELVDVKKFQGTARSLRKLALGLL